MNIDITTYKYVKQEGIIKNLSLPDTTSFYFQTGVRRSIAVIPLWTCWLKDQGKEEEIHSYDIIYVYLSFKYKIEKFTLAISRLNDHYNDTKCKEYEIIDFLLNADKSDIRTKEQFLADYNIVISQCNIALE